VAATAPVFDVGVGSRPSQIRTVRVKYDEKHDALIRPNPCVGRNDKKCTCWGRTKQACILGTHNTIFGAVVNTKHVLEGLDLVWSSPVSCNRHFVSIHLCRSSSSTPHLSDFIRVKPTIQLGNTNRDVQSSNPLTFEQCFWWATQHTAPPSPTASDEH
jgi:hypothetical protein